MYYYQPIINSNEIKFDLLKKDLLDEKKVIERENQIKNDQLDFSIKINY